MTTRALRGVNIHIEVAGVLQHSLHERRIRNRKCPGHDAVGKRVRRHESDDHWAGRPERTFVDVRQDDRTAEIRYRHRYVDVRASRIERHRGVPESCAGTRGRLLRRRQHRSKCLRRNAADKKQSGRDAYK